MRQTSTLHASFFKRGRHTLHRNLERQGEGQCSGGDRWFFDALLHGSEGGLGDVSAGRAGRELYDHWADSEEVTNLAAKPRHAKTVAELSSQLKEYVQLKPHKR